MLGPLCFSLNFPENAFHGLPVAAPGGSKAIFPFFNMAGNFSVVVHQFHRADFVAVIIPIS